MAAALDDILESHLARRPVVAGVLNVTPDSFSDGGRFFDPAAAVERARKLADEGADIIDVGAESSRPGSERVSPDEQIRRLSPVLPEAAKLGPVVSIDTTSAAVAEFALACGARIINDISAGREDAGIFPLAAKHDCALVLMHMLGAPKTMQQNPRYADVVAQVRDFLAERLSAAARGGVDRRRCIVDPGIGFGKTVAHNLALLAGVGGLAQLGVPVMVGPSRKWFIGQLTGQDQPELRLGGTLAACLEAYRRGATIFRVHDVQQVRSALLVAQALGGFCSDARRVS